MAISDETSQCKSGADAAGLNFITSEFGVLLQSSLW